MTEPPQGRPTVAPSFFFCEWSLSDGALNTEEDQVISVAEQIALPLLRVGTMLYRPMMSTPDMSSSHRNPTTVSGLFLLCIFGREDEERRGRTRLKLHTS